MFAPLVTATIVFPCTVVGAVLRIVPSICRTACSITQAHDQGTRLYVGAGFQVGLHARHRNRACRLQNGARLIEHILDGRANRSIINLQDIMANSGVCMCAQSRLMSTLRAHSASAQPGPTKKPSKGSNHLTIILTCHGCREGNCVQERTHQEDAVKELPQQPEALCPRLLDCHAIRKDINLRWFTLLTPYQTVHKMVHNTSRQE